jgi:hypothetical protein
MAKRILIRRDTTPNWQSVNPILSNGELGIEIKNDGTRKIKLGTGDIPWNSLDYFIDDFVTNQDFATHRSDTTAHYATDTPVANLIARYNSDKGLKSDKIPTENNDVIRKTELDDVSGTVSGIRDDVDNIEDNLITALQSDVTDLGTQLDDEINNRITAVSGAISTAASDATTKADAAETNAKQYADTLSLSTQIWLESVNTKADLPANPGSGTYLCRVITGDDAGVYQWIGSESSPSWTLFSDNEDFISKIPSPVVDNIPVITIDGELADGGTSISDIQDEINAKENAITAGTTSQYYRGDKTWQTLSKSAVGLGDVDNTSDIDKPISTAVSDALDEKADVSELDNYYTETETDNLLDEKEPLKYIAADETSAETYSASHSDIMVFYPEE